jgi:hypothetical protein
LPHSLSSHPTFSFGPFKTALLWQGSRTPGRPGPRGAPAASRVGPAPPSAHAAARARAAQRVSAAAPGPATVSSVRLRCDASHTRGAAGVGRVDPMGDVQHHVRERRAGSGPHMRGELLELYWLRRGLCSVHRRCVPARVYRSWMAFSSLSKSRMAETLTSGVPRMLTVWSSWSPCSVCSGLGSFNRSRACVGTCGSCETAALDEMASCIGGAACCPSVAHYQRARHVCGRRGRRGHVTPRAEMVPQPARARAWATAARVRAPEAILGPVALVRSITCTCCMLIARCATGMDSLGPVECV